MFSLFTLLLTTANAGSPADCEAPVSIAQLQTETLQTTLSYATLNVDDFRVAYTNAHAALDCVTERLPIASVLDFHRTEALGAFVQGDHERARTAFQALLSVDKDWQLPANLAPEGGVLAQKLAEARAKPPSLMVDLSVPDGVVVLINGSEASQRPANTPFVLQVLSPAGEVLWTDYVLTGEPMRDLAPLVPAGAVSPPPVEPPPDASPPDLKTPLAPPAEKGRWRFGVEVGSELGVRIERRSIPSKRLSYGLRLGTAAPVGVPLAMLPYLELRLYQRVFLDGTMGLAVVPGGAVPIAGFAVGYRAEPWFVRLGLAGTDAFVGPDITAGWMF